MAPGGVRGVVAVTVCAAWFGARVAVSGRIDLVAAQAMANDIKNHQMRAGQLSSYKGLALTRSPWPLGEKARRNVTRTVGLYRIIGNPLPPRHDARQLYMNLQYMLKHEPPLEFAEKIYVLNRLNATLEGYAKRLIESHGHEVVVLKFRPDEYRAYQTEDSYGLHPDDWGMFNQPKWSKTNANLYLMNNNGARNAALRDGVRRGFRWTLPFDGNCFFTLSDWATALRQLDESERAGVKYAALPMVRTAVNESEISKATFIRRRRGRRRLAFAGPPGDDEAARRRLAGVAGERRLGTLPRRVQGMPGLTSTGEPGEHQIAFHHTASFRFDPTVPYGHRPKVSLLWKLRVPGAWDKWNHDVIFRAEGECNYLGLEKTIKFPSVCKRTLPRPYDNADVEAKEVSAIVYRLPDSWPESAKEAVPEDTSAAMWGDNYFSRRNRRDLRDQAIIARVEAVNAAVPPSTRGVENFVKPLFFNVYSMETMRREWLVHKAESGLNWAQPSKLLPRRGVLGEHHCDQIDGLVALADRQIGNAPFSVVDKVAYIRRAQRPLRRDARGDVLVNLFPEPPPNSSANHYLNLGAYSWRVGELPDDVDVTHIRHIPRGSSATAFAKANLAHKLRDPEFRRQHAEEFVRWDGHVRPDGKLWGPGSQAYDRTRAYDMMTNVTMYSLAHFYTGKPKYADKAVSLIRTWFLNPATRMLPSLAYAQWLRPHAESSGLVQFNFLTLTLDAVALIERSTAWSARDRAAMRGWCRKFSESIGEARERNSKTVTGWWYILQVAAVDRCAGQNTTKIGAMVKERVGMLATFAASRGQGAIPRAVHNGNAFFLTYAPILAWRLLQHQGDIDTSRHLATVIRNTATGLLTDGKANLEHATPICQWALDFNSHLGLSLDACKGGSAIHERRALADETPLPSEEILKFYLPPLLPRAASHGLFPFMNLMW